MTYLKRLGFFTAFILPALTAIGYYAGGTWNWLAIGFVFILITFIDFWIGLDTRNVPSDQVSIVSEEFYYRFITYVWTYFQVGFVIWSCYAVTTGKLTTWYEWIGFTISVGLVTGGIGITVAHELGHKKSKLEQLYSQVILMTVCYMHFFIEHNRGHHVQVATPADPATARKGENVYAFWFRSVFVGYAHAWQLEKESLTRQGLSVFSWHNRMIRYLLLPGLFCAAVIVLFFTPLVPWYTIPVFFFTQSIIAFTLLELVNYIEHYGIVRKQKPNGEYERVNPLHSWNASHLISNFFLFQLQRHSDHHANAIKRYQVLDHVDDSPQLPFGYPAMILIALVPPLWFRFMHPRLAAWQKQVYLQHTSKFS
jgi:alkane 1-monooxygenase